jgi:gliding motility-associated lipoprotein GldH
MSYLRRSLLFFIVPLLVLLISSCDSKRFFEENKSIRNGVWNSNERMRFDVPVTDTLSGYNFFLNVRNAGDYPYSNLYLFIHTSTPDGKTGSDTMECQLASYDGKWLGSGIGNLKFNRYFFQENVRFHKRGVYHFEIEQAMRVKVLKGIHDIGLRIEKNTNNNHGR